MEKTTHQFDRIIEQCRQLFLGKTKDYGSSWRILRSTSLTDQLYIKAKRIRSIEEKGIQKVGDPIEADYKGLINYSIMALIQYELGQSDNPQEMGVEAALEAYDEQVKLTKDLLVAKNHDYGEVWREMRLKSITDLILMKLLRIKQIENNDGKTIVSEGIEANYRDIINYAIFALILISEANLQT